MTLHGRRPHLFGFRKRVQNKAEESHDESNKIAEMDSGDDFDADMHKLCIQGHLGDGPPQEELLAEGTPREREVIMR